jgi:hypothetical protein
MLKELFPDWTDADLVLAIEDSDGDLERTIEKISEGKCTCLHVAHGVHPLRRRPRHRSRHAC